MYLPDYGRQHVPVFQMEIVVRAIQVRGHYRYVVRAVLEVETLAHLKPRNFGYRIGFVCVLKRRSQQHVLFHRLRRVAGIYAR